MSSCANIQDRPFQSRFRDSERRRLSLVHSKIYRIYFKIYRTCFRISPIYFSGHPIASVFSREKYAVLPPKGERPIVNRIRHRKCIKPSQTPHPAAASASRARRERDGGQRCMPAGAKKGPKGVPDATLAGQRAAISVLEGK